MHQVKSSRPCGAPGRKETDQEPSGGRRIYLALLFDAPANRVRHETSDKPAAPGQQSFPAFSAGSACEETHHEKSAWSDSMVRNLITEGLAPAAHTQARLTPPHQDQSLEKSPPGLSLYE